MRKVSETETFIITNLNASEKRIGLPNIASLVILVEPKKQPFQQIPLVSGKKDVKVFLVQTGGFLGNRILLGIKIAELQTN